MIWPLIISTLALAAPEDIEEDIESLGNSTQTTILETEKKNEEKGKHQDQENTEEDIEKESEEELEQELEEELEEDIRLQDQEELEIIYQTQNPIDPLDDVGIPENMTHQDDLDPRLFENPNPDKHQANNQSSNDFLEHDDNNLDDVEESEGLYHAVYDSSQLQYLNEEEKEGFENDKSVFNSSTSQSFQNNVSSDELLFSTLQKEQKVKTTEEYTEDGSLESDFQSDPASNTSPNNYAIQGEGYQKELSLLQIKEEITKNQADTLGNTEGYNPYMSKQNDNDSNRMYKPENSKGFTVELNHDFENPYDIENLLHQNSTLQNSVQPASEITTQNIPEFTYSKNTEEGKKTYVSVPENTMEQQIPKNMDIPEKIYTPQFVQETEVMALPDISKEYRLGSGDTITIYAWSGDFIERNISKNYVVADTGYIQLPIVGSVKIGNLTTSEASALITDTLSEYIKNPIVQLQMQRPKSQKIWLLGNISRPGIVFLDGPKTLIQALSERGLTRRKRGNGAWAETKIHIQREDGTVFVVDTEKLLETGEGNIYLRGGDSIFITDGSYIYLNGKFTRSGPVAFSEGMTVSDACAEAMGYDEEANLRKLYINRNGKQILVDLKSIFQGEAEDVVLEQGDRLYLEESIW